MRGETDGKQPSTLEEGAEFARPLSLKWLTPEYKQEQHGIYREAMMLALSHSDASRPLNVAITGPYGSGKSSVLNAVADGLPSRVTNISLSSLGGNEPGALGDDPVADPSSPKVTKFIQKEIVKQLLFSRAPGAMRGSRYSRVSAFRPLDAALWSLVLALAACALYFLLGGEQRLEELIPADQAALRPLGWGVLIVLIGLVVYMVQAATFGRIRIEKLTAGPATVALTDKGSYYFDEYLDEIIFYFDRTRHNVVIFEDLDRFDNPHIFDTLRELNTILNSAEQLSSRPIQFVYAIKDSMFEQLGSEAASRGEVVPATNRTKFFDLVIPIVPFISHRTARDIIGPEMADAAPAIGDGVITIVGRHVTDMRLIKNIRNEYEIFSRRIFRPDGIKNLSPDALFAMVVYKNAHLSDFERIVDGSSNLDEVYALMRSAVDDNIRHLDQGISEREKCLANVRSNNAQSEAFGLRLIEVMEKSSSGVQNIEAGGKSFGKAAWTSVAFWTAIAAADEVLLMNSNGTRHRRSGSDISDLVGEPIAGDAWTAESTKVLRSEIDAFAKQKQEIRSASVSTLLSMGVSINPDAPEQDRISFSAAVRSLLSSDLGFELMLGGYLDENFGLYSVQYYGFSVSATAMTYILKVVQPRASDFTYHFDSGNDIDQLEVEAGDDLRNEGAIFNLEIFDHLLERRPESLRRAMLGLAKPGELESRFLHLYLRNGFFPLQLIRNLAALRADIFDYLSAIDDLEVGEKDELLSSAIIGAAGTELDYSAKRLTRSVLADRLSSLEALANEVPAVEADRIVRLLKRLGVQVRTLARAAAPQRRAIVEQNAFALNRENLLALSGTELVALDALRGAVPETTFEHIIDNADEYLRVLRPNDLTISSQASFEDVVATFSEDRIDVVAEIVARSSMDCEVEDLLAFPVGLWPALIRSRRVQPTLHNVAQYLLVHSYKVDQELADYLRSIPKITSILDPLLARKVAIAIADASELDVEVRAALLKPLVRRAPLVASEIRPQPGPFFGALVKAGLLVNSFETFTALRGQGWDAQRAVANASTRFGRFLTGDVLTADEFDSLATDPAVASSIKIVLAAQLDTYGAVARKSAVTTLGEVAAQYRIGMTWNDVELALRLGVSSRVVIAIARSSIPTLDEPTLLTLLRNLGGEYERLARRERQVKLPKDEAHEALLRRLNELQIVGKFPVDKDGKHFRAYTKYA